MSLRIILRLLYFLMAMKDSNLKIQKDYRILINFTCATAKDELEKHPEMRTIAMIELESNFPSEFSREVLKCLPVDVAKIVINPHSHKERKSTLNLPRKSMLMYVADKVEWDETFHAEKFYFERNFAVVSHLSKHLIISSEKKKIKDTQEIFRELLNVVQIHEENRKVIARSFDMTRNLTTFETFESSQRENLSQILFPDKTKNLNGFELFAVFMGDNSWAFQYSDEHIPNTKWNFYLYTIAEKLNATLTFIHIPKNKTSRKAYHESMREWIKELVDGESLDFFLNYPNGKFDLESYNNNDWCFVAPLPEPFSVTELILSKPMDKSCWMWLGITIAVSTFVWRVSEGHWNFPFGSYAYFMGQAQLIIRIRTSRLTMKILLQLLIFAIFIFSNGYQSLVTSFMLNPLQLPLLRSVDEVLDSNMMIQHNQQFHELYESNQKYQKAQHQKRVKDFPRKFRKWTENLVKLEYTQLLQCKDMKFRIEIEGDGKSFQGVYLVPDAALTLPEDLYVRPFHPFLDIFQELMDRSLEAGLHQAWEKFYYEIWQKEWFNRKESDDKNDILDFSLIAPFFLILAFGFGVAVLALLFEIFCKDFVSKLTRDYFKRKWNEIIARRKQRSSKGQIVQVKPVSKRI